MRWGLEALPCVLEELSVSDPLPISTERWRDLDPSVARRFDGALPPAKANPRPAPPEAVLVLLEEVW